LSEGTIYLNSIYSIQADIVFIEKIGIGVPKNEEIINCDWN